MFAIKDKEERTSFLLKEENKVKVQQGKKSFEMGKDQVRQDSNRLSYLKKKKTGKEEDSNKN